MAVVALPLALALGIASIPQNVADDLQRAVAGADAPGNGTHAAQLREEGVDIGIMAVGEGFNCWGGNTPIRT